MSKLVGFKDYSFENEKKELVQGTNLYFAKEVSPNLGKGIEIEKVSVSKAKLLDVVQGELDKMLNQPCHIQYNKYGKAEYIALAKG